MKTLTQRFTELVPHADYCNFKKYQRSCTCEKGQELTLNLIQAVKERDEEVLGEEEEPTNVMHPHYERFLDEYENREEVRAEIKQKMEETI